MQQKIITFFQQKKKLCICNVYLLNFNETLTNDVVNCKQPAPVIVNLHDDDRKAFLPGFLLSHLITTRSVVFMVRISQKKQKCSVPCSVLFSSRYIDEKKNLSSKICFRFRLIYISTFIGQYIYSIYRNQSNLSYKKHSKNNLGDNTCGLAT